MSTATSRKKKQLYRLVAIANAVPSTLAYSFNFASTPQQCGNLTINIVGSDGTPPYRALVIPFGQSPLPNNVEARRIVDQHFDGNSTSTTFQLKYPTNSQFVVVVSTHGILQDDLRRSYSVRSVMRRRLEVGEPALQLSSPLRVTQVVSMPPQMSSQISSIASILRIKSSNVKHRASGGILHKCKGASSSRCFHNITL